MAKSNLNWAASNAEQYAEKYWHANGYSAKLVKRFVSKSVYEISKDGVIDKYEVPNAVKDPTRYMVNFERYWEILKDAVMLRKQV